MLGSFHYIKKKVGNCMVRFKTPDVAFYGILGVLASIAVGLHMHYKAGQSITDSFMMSGIVVTAIGVYLAFATLRASHEWNRRHYTVEMAAAWNHEARALLANLTMHFPEFFQVPDFISDDRQRDQWCIDEDMAERLVFSKSPNDNIDEETIEIRDNLVPLFNHFESIAIAYQLNVIDRDVIFESFGAVLLDTWIFFGPFVDKMREVNRRDPWPPLTELIHAWEGEEKRRHFEKRLEETKKQEQAAKEKLILKPPTG